jgi:DNA-binding transcriptional LysR family regulator
VSPANPPRLPPLNALKAFESAARHLSLKRAAEELNVTPAAVSHQVKALEDYVGVALFRRLNRGLELTAAARAALPQLTEGFEGLARAVAQMPGSIAKVRALDALARLRISDKEVLEELTRSFAQARTPGVQNAIAEIFLRSDYR